MTLLGQFHIIVECVLCWPYTCDLAYQNMSDVIKLSFYRQSGTCSHLIALAYTLQHYQQLGLKAVPDDLSATSLPQQLHKPRGRKIKPQPVSSLVMAKPKNISRKRRPCFSADTQLRYVSTTKGNSMSKYINPAKIFDLLCILELRNHYNYNKHTLWQ